MHTISYLHFSKFTPGYSYSSAVLIRTILICLTQKIVNYVSIQTTRQSAKAQMHKNVWFYHSQSFRLNECYKTACPFHRFNMVRKSYVQKYKKLGKCKWCKYRVQANSNSNTQKHFSGLSCGVWLLIKKKQNPKGFVLSARVLSCFVLLFFGCDCINARTFHIALTVTTFDLYKHF